MQEKFKLFDGEYKFVSIIWDHEPIPSPELVQLCSKCLGWKKSTTYTVLSRLCQRGVLQNENTIVTSLVKREQAQKYESEAVLSKAFNGSLPAFIAAFLDGKRISEHEAREIQRMIEEASE